ncbi:hypothetical protein HYZ64_03265 [Candidatus Berkelbacteria bacterium]|nr:hypothetical protein [Candidatus Berkelbacteria bacterium]
MPERIDVIPANCTGCYRCEWALRNNSLWEASVPVNTRNLNGWFGAMPYEKRALAGVEDEADQLRVVQDHQAHIAQKAANVLEETTRGFVHQGKDSMIPGDIRFKRTKNLSLYFGAGNILGAIREAAWYQTDNPGAKRRLGGDPPKLYLRPGKVVIFRPHTNGYTRIPVTMADGRHERHSPPEAPAPKNMFRGKKATSVLAEYVAPPARLHFYLWVDPKAASFEQLELWTRVAGDLGLGGYRQMRQGQFDVLRFEELDEDVKQGLLNQGRQKQAIQEMEERIANIE